VLESADGLTTGPNKSRRAWNQSRRSPHRESPQNSSPVLIAGGVVVGVILLAIVGGAVAILVTRPTLPQQPGPPVLVNPGGLLPPEQVARPQLGPVQWKIEDGGNGHYYEFVPGNISWTEAKRAAEARVFQGVNGHLATITSAAEKEFMRKALPAHKAWLGGYQDTQAPDYSEPAGGWRWVTGEKWDYTNWSTMSPDEFDPHQDFLVLDPGAPPWEDGTRWDDAPDNYEVAGYYVEYPTPAGK
jgi:hypothetical protein